MSHTTTTAYQVPTTAERIQSACARALQSVLAIPGAEPVQTQLHYLRRSGDVLVAVESDSIATAMAWQSGHAGVPAMLELTDTAPIPFREPVRSLVWLRGTLRPVPHHAERVIATEIAGRHPHPALLDVGHGSSLLRVVVASAVVADASGAEPVSKEDLRDAEPDPFWEMEASWLQHLDSDHPEVIDRLAQKLPVGMRYGRIRPLALDRFGLTLRIEIPDRDRDVRLPFIAPVADVNDLSRAIRLLMGCPFLNGLRARR